MAEHVMTTAQLRHQGIHGSRLRQLIRRGRLVRLLPGVYCDRRPTTADKCRGVSLWREDAVLSHLTAAWLHGWCGEPDVIEAYVSSEPSHPLPSWLQLHIAPYETYAAGSMKVDTI